MVFDSANAQDLCEDLKLLQSVFSVHFMILPVFFEDFV